MKLNIEFGKKIGFLKEGESSLEDIAKRIAPVVASVEIPDKREEWKNKFYNAISSGSLIPAGRIIRNINIIEENGIKTIKVGHLSNCYILAVSDDIYSIAELNRNITIISACGGGFGVNFSELRPKGDEIKGRGGISTGAVSFMRMINGIGGEVKSGGNRRSAGAVILNIDHPDIYEFIQAKLDYNQLNNLNISVGVTNEFINAVKNNENWDLKFRGKIYKTIKAKELWDYLLECAIKSAEPGFVNLSNVRYYNPGNYYEKIDSLNPCLSANSLLLDNDRLSRIKNGNSYTYKTWKTKTIKTIKLICNNGLELDCTTDHKIQLKNGEFKEAKDSLNQEIKLALGDRQANIIDEKIMLKGFLYGDGSICGSGLGIQVKLNTQKEFEVVCILKKYGFIQQKSGAFYINKKKLEHTLGNLNGITTILPNRYIQEEIIIGDSNIVASFLKGIFSANGSTNIKGQVSFKTTNKNLAKDIQILLLSFGIRSWRVTNKPSTIKWHNGIYTSKESYNLQIAPNEAWKFKEKIGFIHQYKMDRIKSKNKEQINHKVFVKEIVQNLIEEDVYDFSMQSGNPYNFANGFIVHNCFELPGEANTACALSSINLHNFVNTGKLDKEGLAKTARIAQRFLDNIITTSQYPILTNKEIAEKNRRIGIGVIGFAHALIEMKIKYGSEECLDFIDEVWTILRDNIYLASVETSQEKGFFPAFTSAYLDTPYIRRLPRNIRAKIKEHGIRNVAMLSCPPNGDTGIFTNLSNGIEPIPSKKYKRADKHIFLDPIYEKYKDNKEYEPYFVGMYDISPKEHLEVQAHIQKYVDNSISKTVNVSKAKVNEFKKAILDELYNLKGTTLYVEGSRKEHISIEDTGECSGGVCQVDKPIE